MALSALFFCRSGEGNLAYRSTAWWSQAKPDDALHRRIENELNKVQLH
jgi:hypothetical protein